MSVDRLRIAMLIWSYWPGHEGGAERQCRKLVPRLAAQGLDIAVWTARTHRDHARRERAGDHEILRLGAGVPLLAALRRAIDSVLARLLPGTAAGARRRAQVREAAAFWLGLPLTWAARTSFLLAVARQLRKSADRPDVIHVHESSWLAGAAARLARRYGIPVLAKTAIFPAWNKLGYDVPLRGTLSEARRGCRFIALAPYLADDLAANGIPRARIFIVPNGVEIPPAAAETDSKDVLFVANFSQGVEHKAFDVLIQAWSAVVRQVPEARLHLLGDGERGPWERLVRDLHVENSVVFAGWTPDPAEHYRRAAAFVLPSRMEGMSNSLLEAQSWGLGCVVSDIAGNLAVVEDGINGLVVPTGDATALAAAIVRLLLDGPLRARLGRTARQQAQDRNALDIVAARLAGIYREVAAPRQSGVPS